MRSEAEADVIILHKNSIKNGGQEYLIYILNPDDQIFSVEAEITNWQTNLQIGARIGNLIEWRRSQDYPQN